MHGVDHYVPMERVFAYEHGNPYLITDNTRDNLMAEIDMEEFREGPLPSRIVLNDLEQFIRESMIDVDSPADVARLKEKFASDCLNADIAIECLKRFCHTDPRLPDRAAKGFVSDRECLGIDLEMGREEMIARLQDIRDRNEMADMAFYAYRDLNRTEAKPFLLAALKRNPVSVEGARDMDTPAVVEKLRAMPAESIYDETGRLAQPDEVWNYGRGDGAEKAILLANILCHRVSDEELALDVSPSDARLKAGSDEYVFDSRKGLKAQRWSLSISHF
jgi:hypothetical protein